MTALDYARGGSRKVYKTLAELLGKEDGTDHFDTTDATLKRLSEAAETPAFSDLVNQLAERLDSEPRPWKRRKGVTQFRVKLKTIGSEVSEGQEDELQHLEALQELARQHGATLVYQEIPIDARHEVRALLVPTVDWAAIVRMCGTNGANYGLSTRDVVNRLAKIGELYPFEIQGCGHDFVAIRFSPMDDFKSLDKALLELCPDLSDGPGEDRSGKDEFYQNDRRCFLWWD